MSNEIVTLHLESAADSKKKYSQMVDKDLKIKDIIAKSCVQLFGEITPQRVGLNTLDGAIIANWEDSTVGEIIDRYDTNHLVVGTPDQLG